MNSFTRNIVLLVVIAGTIGSIVYLESKKVSPSSSVSVSVSQEVTQATSTMTATSSNPVSKEKPLAASSPELLAKAAHYKKYIEIANPSGFINTGDKPITIKEFTGKKVVLVDFWTYSCINCQRTLPYLVSWYKKYKDAGLEIVSIHTPEFEFEKNKDNVTAAALRFGITYPIVQDNDYGTWRAYNNFYWPHHYLIDIDGYIVEDHIGEGEYEETETKIQELLAERAKRLGTEIPTASTIGTPKGAESVDTSNPLSPEMYFGAFRNEYLGNGSRGEEGIQDLSDPATFLTDQFYLGGPWQFSREYVTSQSRNARIFLRYRAQKVFIVASADTSSVKAKVMLDGAPLPESMRGADVDANGYVIIKENRLYRLVEDKVWGEHTLELIIETPGLEAFTFTFG